MLLTRQLKPLGVSTWKQPMPFANRIKNRYLLPGYYPFKPLFLIWRMGNQAGDLFVQRFINVNFKLILDYREVGKPADTNRYFPGQRLSGEKDKPVLVDINSYTTGAFVPTKRFIVDRRPSLYQESIPVWLSQAY